MNNQKTQREVLFARLKRGWLSSLQAATECACLKLTTRINEPDFIAYAHDKGYTIERREVKGTRYVEYRLKKQVKK